MNSFWRISHLLLAITISLFLIVISITGTILSGNIIINKLKYPYRVDNFEQLNVAQSISALKKQYPEITEISINHNDFVKILAYDADGNEVKAIVNPNNGKILGKPIKKSEFINDTKALHRSLLLHEKGRFAVGIVSFFLFLISITGVILIIKRQNGFTNFFTKIHDDYFPQWFHIVAGRWLLIPIMILSFTGSYLFIYRFELLPKTKPTIIKTPNKNTEKQVNLEDFPIFKKTSLSEVKQIEFPFSEGDPEENFVLKLKDRELEINAFSGEVTKETKLPTYEILRNLNLNLHTGKTNIVWAGILGIASLGILGFIYTGFAITIRRTKAKIKNKFHPNDAEIIILVGSENGTTLEFVNKIQEQLLNLGEKVFINYLNDYKTFNNAKKIIIFTSTYGEGAPPCNADKFENLLLKYPQNNKIEFSVIGFGSKSYQFFCGFAKRVNSLLKNQPWAKELISLHTINDRSPSDFTAWVRDFSQKSGIKLNTNICDYEQKNENLALFKVIAKTPLDTENKTFSIILKPEKVDFQSGDILAIYPANDHRERQYSIGKMGENIRLFVKLHKDGLGSQFLYNLGLGTNIQAKILENRHFHFPQKIQKVAMIANGTGIAPFLGMLDFKDTEKYLYCGFRHQTEATNNFTNIARNQINTSLKIGYSRSEMPKYVMDLVNEDELIFVDILQNNGVIMICGSLRMQKDIETTLSKICEKNKLNSIDFYKKEGKILTDCY